MKGTPPWQGEEIQADPNIKLLTAVVKRAFCDACGPVKRNKKDALEFIDAHGLRSDLERWMMLRASRRSHHKRVEK